MGQLGHAIVRMGSCRLATLQKASSRDMWTGERFVLKASLSQRLARSLHASPSALLLSVSLQRSPPLSHFVQGPFSWSLTSVYC